ncbi:MAG: carboxypeptidase regulatory-like domain-containing protein, partial [Candidatus Methanomethylophilus sp.]|nr:carboxypeptidase regulatory-like domain-containing protein [Methanomethylophilus sp.]
NTDRLLWNAMITLTDKDTDQEYSGQTDNNGKHKFTDLPYGTYSLKITCNGYQTYTESSYDYHGQVEKSVSMVEKVIPTFYGMTTYHALMMLGVGVGLALVLISYTLVRRNWKGIKE